MGSMFCRARSFTDLKNSFDKEIASHPAMTNPIMERRARLIFRDALIMHYMEGPLETGNEVEEWLRTHGGWFPDPAELYGDGTPDDQPMDEGEEALSADSARAFYDAKIVMGLLLASLITASARRASVAARRTVERIMSGGMEDDIEEGVGESDDDLLDAASAWMTEVYGRYTLNRDEATEPALGSFNVAAMLSSAAGNVATTLGGVSNITFGSRNRNRSRSRDFRAPFEDVLIGPGLLQGRENTIENSGQHTFTGTSHRLE